MREAKSSSPAARNPALAELIRRIGAGTLSDAQTDSAVQFALKMQADRTRPWIRAYGDLVRAAHERGKLSEKQWELYIRQALAWDIFVRPRVRRGDPAVVMIANQQVQLDSQTWLGVEYPEAKVTISGQVVRLPRSPWGTATHVVTATPPVIPGAIGRDRTVYPIDLDPYTLEEFSDGPQTLKWDFRAIVHSMPTGARRMASGPVIADIHVPLTATFTLLPEDQPTVTLVHDESLRQAVQSAFSVSQFRRIAATGMIEFTITANRPPADLACQVALRRQNKRWFAAPVQLRAKVGPPSWTFLFPGAALPAGKFDVVLSPDPAEAARTLDITRICDEPIVIKDVTLPDAARGK